METFLLVVYLLAIVLVSNGLNRAMQRYVSSLRPVDLTLLLLLDTSMIRLVNLTTSLLYTSVIWRLTISHFNLETATILFHLNMWLAANILLRLNVINVVKVLFVYRFDATHAADPEAVSRSVSLACTWLSLLPSASLCSYFLVTGRPVGPGITYMTGSGRLEVDSVNLMLIVCCTILGLTILLLGACKVFVSVYLALRHSSPSIRQGEDGGRGKAFSSFRFGMRGIFMIVVLILILLWYNLVGQRDPYEDIPIWVYFAIINIVFQVNFIPVDRVWSVVRLDCLRRREEWSATLLSYSNFLYMIYSRCDFRPRNRIYIVEEE